MVSMDATAKSDAELVADTLAGDREAFGELYDRHARLVRAVVVGVSGDWSSVDDMTQECFLRAYRKLATLRDRARVSARGSPASPDKWPANASRSLRRDRHEFSSKFGDVAATTDGEPAACDHDQIDRVMRRLAELPDNERLAIHAFYLEGQQRSPSRRSTWTSPAAAFTHYCNAPWRDWPRGPSEPHRRVRRTNKCHA